MADKYWGPIAKLHLKVDDYVSIDFVSNEGRVWCLIKDGTGELERDLTPTEVSDLQEWARKVLNANG